MPVVGFALVVGCNESPTPPAAPRTAAQGAPLSSPIAAAPRDGAGDTAPPSPAQPDAKRDDEALPVLPYAAGGSDEREATASAPVAARDRGGIRPPGAPDPAPPPKGDSVLTIKPVPLDPAKPVGKPDADKPEYLSVSFNELASFEYDPIEAVTELNRKGEPSATSTGKTEGPKPISGQIPEKIRELNGKKLAMQGFMIPLEVRRNEVKSFLLVRNTMVCCFGAAASFNEWVYVQLGEGKATKFTPDVLISAYGVFDLGEDIQDGMVMSIYRLNSAEVVLKSGY